LRCLLTRPDTWATFFPTGARVGSSRKLLPQSVIGRFRQLCQPEIENLRLAAASNEDVRRLDVAMSDPLVVRGAQPVGNLNGEIEHFLDS
jgi:hypothetical protein